jgi:hypothetical protein
MSDKVKAISEKLNLTILKLDAMEEGFSRATAGFAQLLSEFLMTKIHKCQILPQPNAQNGVLTLEVFLLYATPKGPVQVVVGKTVRPFPLPTEEEACAMLNDFLNAQLADENSDLMLALAGVRRLEQHVAKGPRKKLFTGE